MIEKLFLCCIVTLAASHYSVASTQKKPNKRLESSPNHYLSEEQLKQYARDGYLIVRNLFSDREIKNIRTLTNELKLEAFKLAKKHNVQAEKKLIHKGTQFVLDKNEAGHVVKRVVWAGKIRKKLLQHGRLPKVLRPVSQILKSSAASHLINQLHLKVPQDGVAFPWHMDLQNRMNFDENWEDVNGEGSYVVVITAIDKHTLENGPLYAIPSSHLLKDLNFPPFCETEMLPKELKAAEKAIPLLMNSGDTVFMHPRLVHGSWENNSQNERKTFINGFSYPGANHAQYPGEGSGELIHLDTTQ